MHDPRYKELVLKFGMSEDEFHSRRNHCPLFNKVANALSHGADVYKILPQIIDIANESNKRLNKIAELYGKPDLIIKQ